jgi:predicted enzyme related to lactoylglutathione lyase
VSEKPAFGKILWHDLTIPNADEVRDFYKAVAGWDHEEVNMGDYSDYSMKAGEEVVAGVCHAKGPNAEMPPQWMMYITVEDLDKTIAAAEARGGQVVGTVREMGENRMAVIRDPAGATAVFYQ